MNKIIISILMLIIFGCKSSTEPNLNSFVETSSIPIATGIYETSYFSPEGTGRIFGVPSYYQKRIAVFPNPLIAIPPKDTLARTYELIINHLPVQVKAKIVSATHIIGYPYEVVFNNSINSIKLPHVVRELTKNNNSSILKWNLKDENGNFVPSGLYRIYLESEYFERMDTDRIIWLDAYIVQHFDFDTWIDPTGWLPSNYFDIVIDPNL